MASTDETKGKIKEAAGDLTDNQDLKSEGKTDQASGKIQEKVGDIANAIKDKLKRD